MSCRKVMLCPPEQHLMSLAQLASSLWISISITCLCIAMLQEFCEKQTSPSRPVQPGNSQLWKSRRTSPHIQVKMENMCREICSQNVIRLTHLRGVIFPLISLCNHLFLSSATAHFFLIESIRKNKHLRFPIRIIIRIASVWTQRAASGMLSFRIQESCKRWRGFRSGGWRHHPQVDKQSAVLLLLSTVFIIHESYLTWIFPLWHRSFS